MNSSAPAHPNLFIQAYLYGVAEEVVQEKIKVEQAISKLYQPRESLRVHTPLPVSFSPLVNTDWLPQPKGSALLCAPLLVSFSPAVESITARVARSLTALMGSGVLGLGLALDLTGDQGLALVLWEGQSSNEISFKSASTDQVAPPGSGMSLSERLNRCQAQAQESMKLLCSTTTFQDKAGPLESRIRSAQMAKQLATSLPQPTFPRPRGLRF